MDDQRKHQDTQETERRKRDEERDKIMLEIMLVVSAMSIKTSSSMSKVDYETKVIDYSTQPASDILFHTLNFLGLPS